MANVLCVLYDDPIDGYPRGSIPKIERYPDGQSAPTPQARTAPREYDLEGMQVGSLAAGRIGSAVLRRLAPLTSACTTPIATDCRRMWSASWA